LFQLLKHYGFTEWNDVVELINAQSGKQINSGTYRLVKDRGVLILSETKNNSLKEIIINNTDKAVKTNLGTLAFSAVKELSNSNNSTVLVDKDLLKFPLSVRAWQEGDYFYPFGMKGKKKLSKFFKDEKLSLLEKEKIELLCSGDKIMWVIGKRFDDRFKVTNKTKQILKITYK